MVNTFFVHIDGANGAACFMRAPHSKAGVRHLDIALRVGTAMLVCRFMLRHAKPLLRQTQIALLLKSNAKAVDKVVRRETTLPATNIPTLEQLVREVH